MFGLSMGEVLILGVMALIVVGPKQLPELARTIGRLMSEMRKATDHFTEQLRIQATLDADTERQKENQEAPPPENTESTEYYTPLDQGQSFEPGPTSMTYDPEARRAQQYGLEPEPEQLSFSGGINEEEEIVEETDQVKKNSGSGERNE